MGELVSASMRQQRSGESGDYRVDGADISVTLGGKPVIGGISVTLTTGLTALLGRNGAGKTTFMRVLAGVQRPTAGELAADDRRVDGSRQDRARYLSALGWVPQGPGYPGGMRADRFVEYAAWLRRVPSERRRIAATDALEACHAGELAGHRLGSLSGGERQRVILASAIVGGPRFLLLDEPTVGLDPAQRENYLGLLRRLGATSTILYSTHLVDDVVRTATRVLVLDQGRISHDLSGPDLAAPAEELGERLRRAVIDSTDRNTG